jgi:hypothetical protein
MVARLWVCAEQPLVFHIFALPLYPLVMGLTLTLAAWWMLRGRVHLAKLLIKGVGASAIVLVVLLLLFGAIAVALLATDLDPSTVLQFAPLGWALGGSLLASSSIVYARRHGWQTLRERFAMLQRRGRAVGFMWWMVLVICFSASSAIGARYFISDATGGVFSIPYRLFECKTSPEPVVTS